MARHDPEDIAWWVNKINVKIAGKAFNEHVGQYAIRILERLPQKPKRRVVGGRLKVVARKLGVPRKYLIRSLGLLARHKLIAVSFDGQFIVTFNPRQSEVKAARRRVSLSTEERQRFLALEGYRCGHCGRTFAARKLHIDHIVPFSMLGADAPGNWGALCRSCNRVKWHNFDREWLRYHRQRRVKTTVGVRFARGQLWPRINGRVSLQSRERFFRRLAAELSR